MPARKLVSHNNHLEEAMALLIRKQAAFVEQISRNGQERLSNQEWQRNTEEWMRKAEIRFDNIEQRLAKIEEASLSYLRPFFKVFLSSYPKQLRKKSDSCHRLTLNLPSKGRWANPVALLTGSGWMLRSNRFSP